jgi:hypothetical protein
MASTAEGVLLAGSLYAVEVSEVGDLVIGRGSDEQNFEMHRNLC